jgi:hypothetical protein
MLQSALLLLGGSIHGVLQQSPHRQSTQGFDPSFDSQLPNTPISEFISAMTQLVRVSHTVMSQPELWAIDQPAQRACQFVITQSVVSLHVDSHNPLKQAEPLGSI